MSKYFLILATLIVCSCTSLTHHEQNRLYQLKAQGINTDAPPKGWSRPANPFTAAALNLLPGGGNFYLASGNGAQSEHYLYGSLNLITWPFSVLWGIPEAAIDANTINQRYLVYYDEYEKDL